MEFMTLAAVILYIMYVVRRGGRRQLKRPIQETTCDIGEMVKNKEATCDIDSEGNSLVSESCEESSLSLESRFKSLLREMQTASRSWKQ